MTMTDDTEPTHDPHGEVNYSLVMPFVVTDDHGGPYEKDAFVAGWEANAFACFLRDLNPGIPCRILPEMPFRTGNIPQLDLIAMRFGWRIEAFPVHTEGEDPDGPAFWSNIMLLPTMGPVDTPE